MYSTFACDSHIVCHFVPPSKVSEGMASVSACVSSYFV